MHLLIEEGRVEAAERLIAKHPCISRDDLDYLKLKNNPNLVVEDLRRLSSVELKLHFALNCGKEEADDEAPFVAYGLELYA